MSSNPDWPYPGDSMIARARRIALAYRAVAEAADPAGTARLDGLVGRWGESWAVATRPVYDDDDLLTTKQAAALACVGVATIHQHCNRGLLVGTKHNGQWRFRAGDVADTFTRGRSRNRTLTDTVNGGGTRVPGTRTQGKR